MNQAIARLSALLVSAGCVIAACGGKVVVDVDETGATTSASTGGAATSSTAASSTTVSSTQGAGGAGCDPASHTIDGADYDSSCNVTEDCIAVFLGDFCMPCSCPFWAINVAGKTKYDAEVQVKVAGTPPDTCSCPASVPICADGQCTTRVGGG